MSLAEAVRIVGEASGEDQQRVKGALIEVGLSGAIVATGCLHLSAHPNRERYFAHPVLGGRQDVPAQDWGGQVDWAVSRIGRYDLVQLNRAEIDRWLGVHETAPSGQELGAAPPRRGTTVAPADEKVISIQTGLPGKPTSWHLIEAECRRRHEAGEQHDTKAEWARQLRAWIVSQHPGVPRPTEKTITNRLTELLRELRNSPK